MVASRDFNDGPVTEAFVKYHKNFYVYARCYDLSSTKEYVSYKDLELDEWNKVLLFSFII
jgi:hypothetical protein